ncbi:MAG TPA: glycosyltransferase family 1 protein [Acidimicrobiales bacterium]|nr:glycosyltransferase family 1 protein [Acidimicrobiales bacterium]
MRVSLDVTAVPATPAGAGRYTVELASALAARTEPKVVVLARRTDAERWRRLATGRLDVLASAPSPRPLRLAWEQLGLPRVLHRVLPDVHHAPHYTMPERSSVPVVVTVHDCTYFDHPEWHEPIKVRLFRRAIRVAARRAGALVCVSETTARELATFCRVDAPVVVAPHGVDHARFTPDAPSRGSDDAAIGRLGVDPGCRYVLFLGTVEPRKDVATLVRAFSALGDDERDLLLVVAGRRGWGTSPVDEALAASAHRDRIIWTGYVPDDAVPALLRNAAVVAYPSLAEGYGLPALEALACGAPLVTTEGTAMAELAGDAAVLVARSDPDGLADALAGVLREAGGVAAARRREVGLARAASRTWAASAERHVEAYRIASGA